MVNSLETEKPSTSLMNKFQIVVPFLKELQEGLIKIVPEFNPLRTQIRSVNVNLQDLAYILPAPLEHHISDERND